MTVAITSVPHLFAVAHGQACEGPNRCYYCSAPCSTDHPAATYVKDSFTGRSGVAAPGSPWVCNGCVLALRESAEIMLVGGEKRSGQRVRGYSWIVMEPLPLAATKAHLATLREICLEPPWPPFAIVLSDSGQTHQLYRGVVNHAREPVVVTLEGERIAYRPAELRSLLVTAGKVCAATGKPALLEPMSPSVAMRVLDRYRGGEPLVAVWDDAWVTPIGRLAAWLCPPRDDCQKEYPADA